MKLALIGAGELGSRHLQALALLDRPATIEVFEPVLTAQGKAEARFAQIKQSGRVSVKFLSRMEDFSPFLDLAIIATTADARLQALEQLLAEKNARYLILEKVVFQDVKSFDKAQRLLSRKKVKAWVNCPRRMWPFYQELKPKFNGEKIDYRASASNLNLGSVAVHLLDHLSFFTGEYDYELSSERLDPDILLSKRPGFREFTGTLEGRLAGGSAISITSYREGNAPFLIQLSTQSLRCLIREPEGKAWLAEEGDGWQWQEIPFKALAQSQLTHLAAAKILNSGESELPTFEQSREIHIPLLKTLTAHFSKIINQPVSACPIT